MYYSCLHTSKLKWNGTERINSPKFYETFRKNTMCAYGGSLGFFSINQGMKGFEEERW